MSLIAKKSIVCHELGYPWRGENSGDLKRRHSWGSEADFRPADPEAGFISGIDPDDPDPSLPEEDRLSYKDNACTVQTVDLVANCPLPVLTARITPPTSPTLTSLGSMGQRPSALSRPKISLTWVLRGQQQPTNSSVVSTGTANRVSCARSTKERSSKRSVKSIANKDRDNDRNTKKENMEHVNKQEPIVVHRVEEIDRYEKPMEKVKLNAKLIMDSPEKQSFEKIHEEDKSSYRDAEKVRRAASEPTLAPRESPVTSSGREKHRHRRAKRPHKPRPPSRSGNYEISDLDSFLTRASIERPANIPVVLSFPSVLYQTQGGIQDEVALPLGTVVNAVFKNQAWLYVQTPHGQEGYVCYAGCLPLGILPQPTRGPCWEDSTDVFPRPLGNMSETDKLRDTRSECGAGRVRTRRGTRDSVSACGERSVDRLYLRAAANAKTKGSRHTLLVIRNDYEGHGGNTISVTKGDVVALLSGHVNEWFWVRSRDGREGFIPAIIAGHGFL